MTADATANLPLVPPLVFRVVGLLVFGVSGFMIALHSLIIAAAAQRADVAPSTRARAPIAIAGALACRTASIVALDTGERNRRIGVRVGERIEVTLQSVGGGEYAASLSSAAVIFLDVQYCGALPAGVTQCFLFRAVSPGQTILTFAHSGMNATVQDTVDVH